ncbi:zinc finger protein 850 isoform X1 [Carassius auratus]|uniref:Zinc finger protein 850-like isoform X1 n=1 Tax=Carassius auratus TaxID=7957 RepID=A0A6P6QFF6_CARAU|nr:zinc finger protein 850-like isoform X1 [Carassius auratus]XP_026132012.1 zinc finger protein 850-like isoform X1 [Carassius auratus]XP_026132013.1 zinc finger protein 850-like isoform X1 [Carassius auratus]XP_026132014.1 zinc finger protein 850-like isoform X1 [Carassius auratus]
MQEPGRTKGFSCRHCGVVCASMPSLLEHTQTFHQSEEERKFKCDECGRGYRHAGSLANHRKTHEVGSFQCHICSRKLSNALALKSHLRIHTSRKKYSCTECGKAFRLATQLVTHQKVHRNKESQIRTKDSANSLIESDYKDDELLHLDEMEFDMIPDLQSDMKLNIAPMNSLSNGAVSEHISNTTTESDMAAEDDAGDRPFKCELCDKTYRHHGSLINHKKTHQMGLFECPVCFKQFCNLAALNSHQRIHSKTRGRLSVQTSKAALTECKQELEPHVMPQNGDDNIHFCHLCQVAFANDDEFQNHILLHNSSSVSFELPTNLSEEHDFSYSDSVTHSPESNPYPPSSDTPPLPPLLDKAIEYSHANGPLENGHIYLPNTLDENPLTLHAQGQPMALQSENLNPDYSAQGTDNIKVEDVDNSDRRFKCHICGKSYRHAGSLINHKRSHQTGIFQCSICRKNYPHLAALRSHLRIHKGRPASLPTSSEGDWLSSEPLTHENQQNCFPSHEEDVSGILGLPHDLVDSVQHKSDEEHVNEMNATEFHEQFDDSFSDEHLPQEELLMERHMCADCGKTFTDIAGIKSHICPLLNQQYQTMMNGSPGHMDFHNTKHHHFLGESGEDVGFEGHNASAAEAYFRQQTFHDNIHGEMSDSEAKAECEDNEEEDDGEMYQCSVCGNHYTSMRALRSHLRGHTQIHGSTSACSPSSLSCLEVKKDEQSENQQGDCSLIICSTCGESFTKKQDLQAHQLLHSNIEGNPQEQFVTNHQNELKPKVEMESIICGKCGVSCNDIYHLNNHNCTGQQDGQVEEKCGENPLLKSTFQREHLQESPHDGERQYKCDQCGRSYRHAGSLLNHKKSHKTGVFRCFVCQKRFYNLLALKNHQRTHFDVKKHRCTECGKAFKIYKQLLNHQRVHQENKAKIEELNKQIQTLMQMSGNASGSGMQALNSSRKRMSRRHKQRQTSNSDHSNQEIEGQMGDPRDPRPFVCDQCGRSYRHAGSLVNHKHSHKTGEYYCSLCNNTYSNQLAMKNHLRIHFAVKRHCCQDCGKAFRGNKQLLNHTCLTNKRNSAARRKVRGRKRENNLTCKKCRLVFPDTELLEGHTCSRETAPDSVPQGDVDSDNSGADLEKEERPFKCNICSRSYRHAGSLLNHKNTHKTGHFTCTFCAKPFSNPMALRNHTRIHTQKKKYVCPTCGKAFRLSSILYNHQKIHARGATHYSCQTCGKRFQGKSGLKRHRCYRNGNPNSTINQEGLDKCYTCDQCGRSYRHAGSLLNHKKTHSTDLLHCTLCLKTFTDPLDLESHSQMARHCCPDCGKTFCEFAHLQSHMEVHSKGLPYYCNICQQNFPNLVSFQQHQELHGGLQGQSHHEEGMQMQQDLGWDSALDQQVGIQSLPKIDSAFSRVHGFPEPQDQQEISEGYGREEKTHVCEHCGRTYRHAGSLLNHKNSHKTGSFFCSVCQKEFTNLMALKNHRRIHTEPKRYQCLECGKAFRVSTQLICHRRIHTKEKPFSCLLCDKHFSSKSNLRHHQKMHQNTQQTYESSFNMDDNAFMGLGVDPFL